MAASPWAGPRRDLRRRRKGCSSVDRGARIDRDDFVPERRERDRNQLEGTEAERDSDDGQAQDRADNQVCKREPPTEQQDPEHVADRRSGAGIGAAYDGSPEGPRSISRNPK